MSNKLLRKSVELLGLLLSLKPVSVWHSYALVSIRSVVHPNFDFLSAVHNFGCHFISLVEILALVSILIVPLDLIVTLKFLLPHGRVLTGENATHYFHALFAKDSGGVLVFVEAGAMHLGLNPVHALTGFLGPGLT